MQYASFLYRKRALRGMRATNKTTITRITIPGTQVRQIDFVYFIEILIEKLIFADY